MRYTLEELVDTGSRRRNANERSVDKNQTVQWVLADSLQSLLYPVKVRQWPFGALQDAQKFGAPFRNIVI